MCSIDRNDKLVLPEPQPTAIYMLPTFWQFCWGSMLVKDVKHTPLTMLTRVVSI